jgi:hypothetical protein
LLLLSTYCKMLGCPLPLLLLPFAACGAPLPLPLPLPLLLLPAGPLGLARLPNALKGACCCAAGDCMQLLQTS